MISEIEKLKCELAALKDQLKWSLKNEDQFKKAFTEATQNWFAERKLVAELRSKLEKYEGKE